MPVFRSATPRVKLWHILLFTASMMKDCVYEIPSKTGTRYLKRVVLCCAYHFCRYTEGKFINSDNSAGILMSQL
jgi:hypothetical protein